MQILIGNKIWDLKFKMWDLKLSKTNIWGPNFPLKSSPLELRGPKNTEIEGHKAEERGLRTENLCFEGRGERKSEEHDPI